MPTDVNTDMTTPSASYTHVDAPRHVTVAVDTASSKSKGPWIALAIVALLLIVGIIWGIGARSADEHQLAQSTHASSELTVSVIRPIVTGEASEIALPGNTQAFNDTPIYARTNGYLKNFFVDIGQHVTQGQLMAIIETPEIDQQLQVAQADLKSAQANLSLADTTAERYQNLLKQDSVSKQETDVAVSGAAARRAAVEAAEANVRRLQQLQSFEKIYAPFSGVVTARNTDIGDLIDAGSGSAQPKDLFRIAATSKLRVFVAVPEIYAPDIHDGDTATLTLDEYPGQQFHGTLVRTDNSINQTSRTLLVEVDVDNQDGKLLPGAYVFTHFTLQGGSGTVTIPSNALLFRSEGLRAGVVRNGQADLVPIKIGRDYGDKVEILSGLGASDQVIVNPSDSLVSGTKVNVGTGQPPGTH